MYPLGLYCPATLWGFQKNQPRKNQPRKKLLKAIIAQKVARYHTKLLELVAESKTVSAEALITAVESPKHSPTSLSIFGRTYDRLSKTGKIGNNVYKDTRRTLKHFTS